METRRNGARRQDSDDTARQWHNEVVYGE
jgi:hypothetical protein